MAISRKPMHVDVEFEERMKELQRQIRRKSGENISLRELTQKIPKFKEFEDIERKILEGSTPDLNLNFDRRRR